MEDTMEICRIKQLDSLALTVGGVHMIHILRNNLAFEEVSRFYYEELQSPYYEPSDDIIKAFRG